MQKKEKFANATIGSALYKFGWKHGGTIKSTQGGYFRRGQRIPIGAKSAGRRRSGVSKGKAKIPSGRPKGAKIACFPKSKHIMKVRRQPKAAPMKFIVSPCPPAYYRLVNLLKSITFNYHMLDC